MKSDVEEVRAGKKEGHANRGNHAALPVRQGKMRAGQIEGATDEVDNISYRF